MSSLLQKQHINAKVDYRLGLQPWLETISFQPTMVMVKIRVGE